MPIKMTQQDICQWILEILVNDLGLKPRDPVPDQKLKEKYRARGGDSADIKVGLEYVADREWLSCDAPTDTWHITDLGHQCA